MRPSEIKTVRMITGMSLKKKQRNANVREDCGIMDVVKFCRNRGSYWKEFVEHIDNI